VSLLVEDAYREVVPAHYNEISKRAVITAEQRVIHVFSMDYVTTLVEPRQRAVSASGHKKLNVFLALLRTPSYTGRWQRFALPTLREGYGLA